jgi:hypothetical protein
MTLNSPAIAGWQMKKMKESISIGMNLNFIFQSNSSSCVMVSISQLFMEDKF